MATTLAARGQVTITLHATPTFDSLGYSTLQTYDFVFVLNSSSTAGSAGFVVTGDHYDWSDEFTFEPPVWSSVSGDGLMGSWVPPAAGIADNASHLIVSAAGSTYVSPHISGATSGTFQISAAADQSNIGLTAQGHQVQWLYFSGSFTGLNFTGIGSTLADPNVYMAGFTGTYATSTSYQGWLRTTDFENAFFTINSLSVSVAAVPEPSTWAALTLGLTLCGIGAYRRRRAR
ncbi:MAG: hypothetical protein C0518_01285 [Opitutus sp.]|nr:hypothetical protein [Opitutus sp.]